MKKLLLVLFLGSITLSSIGQTRTQTPPAGTPRPAKPRAALPYVVKKDFDTIMTQLKSQLRSVQGGLSNLRGSINNKDGEILALQNQMKQVGEVLNSTNFKINLTSDSLSQTRLSLEEVQNENETRFQKLDKQIESNDFTHIIYWILIGLALVLPILVWVFMNNKIQSLQNAINNSKRHLESTLEENQESLAKQIQKMEGMTRSEGKLVQQYSERLVNMVKDENANLRNEVEKMQSTIQVITNELSDLHDRINKK